MGLNACLIWYSFVTSTVLDAGELVMKSTDEVPAFMEVTV